MGASAPQPRLWTREEYYKMVEAGVLRPDERVELIGGRIVTMSPQNSPHFTAIRLVEEHYVPHLVQGMRCGFKGRLI